MTFALASITQAVFARAGRNPSPFPSGDCATRQAAARRDRQGRGRQDDRGGRARPRRGAPGKARRPVRGGRQRAHVAARAGAHHGVRGSRGGEARVAPLPAEVADARRRAGREQPVPVPHRRGARAHASWSRSARSGTSPSSSRRAGDAGLRPRDRRRARHRARAGDAAGAEHVRDIARVGPIGRHAERIDAFLRDPASDRRARGRAARGDAGERDASTSSARSPTSWAWRSTRSW